MHAGPALGQELPDRRVVAEGREQLDPTLADPHRRRLDALVRHVVAVLDACAEQALVGRHRLVEILDGDAEMMDPLRLHGGDPTGGYSGSEKTFPSDAPTTGPAIRSPSIATSSSRSSVSFSRSAFERRSSEARCFSISRIASV